MTLRTSKPSPTTTGPDFAVIQALVALLAQGGFTKQRNELGQGK